jgi:anaerobic selenocysteine-containing dehydrogenase
MMWAANPVVSNPDQQSTRAGLSRDDLFTVVVDLVMTESAKYADIVLPGTSQLEHLDLNDSYSHLYVHWNEPAISPPGQCLPHTEIFRRLAAALDLDEPALFASDEQLIRDALSGGDPSLEGITLEALRDRGFIRLSVPEPYLPFAERFPTPSGRFEFASQRAMALGQGLLPDYVPPVAVSDVPAPEQGAASVVLLSTANHYLINSTFSDSAAHAKSGRPTVLISVDDADRIGLVDEADVVIQTPKGQLTALGRRSADVLPGVAATTKGLSPRLSGGVSVNVTTADREADMARAATFHDNRVTITLARPTGEPAMAVGGGQAASS